MLKVTIERHTPDGATVELAYPVPELRGRLLAKTAEMLLERMAADGAEGYVYLFTGHEPEGIKHAKIAIADAQLCPKAVGTFLKAWVAAQFPRQP